MKRFVFPVFTLFGLALLSVSLWPRQADAVPVFARQVGAPCTMCHVQFPKLNEFGQAFKQNGYRLKGQEGKFVWQKDNLPIAAMTLLTYENKDTKMPEIPASAKEGLISREALEFFSAGSVGPTVSYFFDYHFAIEQPDVVAETYSATPGGTFLILNDLAPDNLLNFRVGVMSNEYLYLSAPRRTTIEDYLAPVSLDFSGLEFNGVHPAGLHYAAGYGNDERVGVGGVDNNLTGYYGWAAYTLQGQTLGVRYYSAKSGDPAAQEGNHTQLDANLDLHYGSANLILGYFTQDKVGGRDGAKQDNFLAEVLYAVGPKVLLTGRYETQNTETAAGSVSGSDTMTVLNVSYFILPNMKLMGEYSKLKGDEIVDRGQTGDTSIDQDTVKIAFQVGF